MSPKYYRPTGREVVITTRAKRNDDAGLRTRLREARGEKSIAEFAAEIGCMEDEVCNVEVRGWRISANYVFAVIKHTGVNEDWLLWGLGRKFPPAPTQGGCIVCRLMKYMGWAA